MHLLDFMHALKPGVLLLFWLALFAGAVYFCVQAFLPPASPAKIAFADSGKYGVGIAVLAVLAIFTTACIAGHAARAPNKHKTVAYRRGAYHKKSHRPERTDN